MNRRLRLALRLWGYREYVRLFPGGLSVVLPGGVFLSVEASRHGGLFFEVFGDDERWPDVYWEAMFAPDEITIGNWYCPATPREWVEEITRWMRP